MNDEEDPGLLTKSYINSKYKTKLRETLEKYKNPANIDKLELAIEKSIEAKARAQNLVQLLIDKGDRLSVIWKGFRRYVK